MRRAGVVSLCALALTAVFVTAFAVTAAVTANGTRTARETLETRCFGAAARVDTACAFAMRDAAVSPTPQEATTLPNAPCRVIARGVPFVCTFGATEGSERRRIALVGDSHASHWRSALAPIAERERWLGFSLTRAGCPLSLAKPVLPPRLLRPCLRWREATLRWLRERSGIDTVIVSQHRVGVEAPPGQSTLEAEIAGYRKAWDSLPPSIRRIVVIRDTPMNPSRSTRCVVRALGRGTPPVPACSFPRADALDADPSVAAARRMRSGRVRVVDMTRFFCGRRDCFPVVGGALVYRTEGHMSATYGETLAPHLAERLASAAA